MEVIKKDSPAFHLDIGSRKVYTNTTGVLVLRHRLLLILSLFMLTLFLHENASAHDKSLVVRVARLQIDHAQLESYKAALKEEIEASIRIESGVLNLYAMSEKDNPTHITILKYMLIQQPTRRI